MVVDVKNISHSWTVDNIPQVLFKSVSFHLDKNSSISIGGVSGSGKSTMLKIIAGLIKPNQGSVSLFNQPIDQLSNYQKCLLRKNNLAFIYQSSSLLLNITAKENIDLFMRLLDIQINEEDFAYYVQKLNLTKKINSNVNILSGGEQQRVGILRALLINPKILVADEPTSNLDKKNTENVAELLSEWINKNHSVLILSTHDPVLKDYCNQKIEL